MEIIHNKYLPFYGDAMCIYPFIFVKNEKAFTARVETHEMIHAYQQVEILMVSFLLACLFAAVELISFWWVFACPFVFYALYAAEWLVRFVWYGFNAKEAYMNISYEQEAYMNMDTHNYLNTRAPFESYSYLFKKTYRIKR